MHYYQFNIKSYQAATLHLSNEEDLAYRRLMDFYYDNESSINAKPDKPTALRVLSRRLRVGIPELEIVLDEFFEFNGEYWSNAYCDQVIADYKAYLEKQRTNGSKGGRGNKANANPDKPTALPEKANAKPTINNKPLTNIKNITPPSGVDANVWNDFVAHRKSKRAAISATALKGIESEARKANISLQAALELCIMRGWTGFKAEWVEEKKTATDKSKAVLSGLTRGLMGGNNAGLLTI